MRVKRGIGVKRSGSSFRLGEIQRLRLVVTEVGIEVKVGDDLDQTIRKRLEDVSLEERVANLVGRCQDRTGRQDAHGRYWRGLSRRLYRKCD